MADLSVKVCGVEFNNPLIAASGTFGFKIYCTIFSRGFNM